MKKLFIVMTTAALNASVMLYAGAAFADSGASGHWKSCASEIEKYCSQNGSDDEIFECLRATLDQQSESISKECRQALHYFERA